MFRSALIKLTAIYLVVLMLISVFFSVLVFGVASREIKRSFNRPAIVRELGPQSDRPLLDGLFKDEIALARRRLAINLLTVNLVIVVAGGGISYLLARATLRPIERAHAAQSRFAADASHELRTPLTTMRTEIEVALRDPALSLDESKKLLRSNLEELSNLGSLTNGLLRLARLGSERETFEDVVIGDAVAAALKRATPLAQAKHVQLAVSGDLGGFATRGDRASLTELFVILLDNAIKYSPKQATVTTTLARYANRASVSVLDEGPGIDPQDLPRIFERFYRADGSRNKKTPGYGIGLSIAKSIADLHGAELKVASTPGKGSRFSVLL